MSQKLNLADVIKLATWDKHWRKTLFWLTVTVVTGLFPTMIGMLALKFLNLEIAIPNFFVHGEFTIYCVGLLTTSLMVVGRELKVVFPHRTPFIFWGAVLLACAAVVHGLIVSVNTLAEENIIPNFTLNSSLAIGFSVLIYVVSIAFCFVIVLIDHVRQDLDLGRLLRQQQSSLETEFDELGESDG